MSRKALKNVLLDLKAQMRGKRASSYLTKVPDEEPVKDIAGISKKASGISDLAESEGPGESLESPKERKSETSEGPVDFADEMKKFFKKQNTGKKREAPSAFASFATDDKKMPKASPAMKKKGK